MRKLSMEELGRPSEEKLRTAPKNPVILALDNVRSFHNTGSVFRTADAFRIEKIILCGITPQPPHRDIHKTALGATETVNWIWTPSVSAILRELKEQGWKIAGIEQTDQSIGLHHFEPTPNRPIAFVLGNEVDGLSEEVLPLLDFCIEIPQLGMKHSLNVSVAAGIVLWDYALKTGMFKGGR